MTDNDEEKLNRDELAGPDNDVKPPEFDPVDAAMPMTEPEGVIEEVGPPEFEETARAEAEPEDVEEDVEPPEFEGELP